MTTECCNYGDVQIFFADGTVLDPGETAELVDNGLRINITSNNGGIDTRYLVLDQTADRENPRTLIVDNYDSGFEIQLDPGEEHTFSEPPLTLRQIG